MALKTYTIRMEKKDTKGIKFVASDKGNALIIAKMIIESKDGVKK